MPTVSFRRGADNRRFPSLRRVAMGVAAAGGFQVSTPSEPVSPGWPTSTGANFLRGAFKVRLRREQAKRVTCRVEKDAVAVPARLMLRSSRAQGQHQVYRGVQILDSEVEVKLLGNLLVWPVRSPVVLDPLEPESRTGPTGERDVPVTTEAHGHPRQLLVEPGQRLGIVAVESDAP